MRQRISASEVRGDPTGQRKRFVFKDRDQLVAEAAGAKLTRQRSGAMKLALKVRDMDLGALLGQPSVELRVLFGNDNAADCVADQALPCASSATAVRCRY